MTAMKFLKNLYEIVSSEAHPSIVWNAGGNGIVILNKPEFIQHSLPRICKTDEYGTFVRQLNNYGFTKVKSYDVDEFVNDRFLKNSPESMYLLKRKTFADKATDLMAIQDNQKVLYGNITHLNEINRKLINEIYYLKEKVNHQEKTINNLVKAFINLFNKPGTKPEMLQLEDIPEEGVSELYEAGDQKEEPDSSMIDAFLDDEFKQI